MFLHIWQKLEISSIYYSHTPWVENLKKIAVSSTDKQWEKNLNLVLFSKNALYYAVENIEAILSFRIFFQ